MENQIRLPRIGSIDHDLERYFKELGQNIPNNFGLEDMMKTYRKKYER